MTDQQILEKAIQKAIDGGWREPNGNKLHVDETGSIYCFVNGSNTKAYGYQFNVESLLYSHGFAKALWGEKGYVYIEGLPDTRRLVKKPRDTGEYLVNSEWWQPAWQYHLQQMVIADDPIAYLGANL